MIFGCTLLYKVTQTWIDCLKDHEKVVQFYGRMRLNSIILPCNCMLRRK